MHGRQVSLTLDGTDPGSQSRPQDLDCRPENWFQRSQRSRCLRVAFAARISGLTSSVTSNCSRPIMRWIDRFKVRDKSRIYPTLTRCWETDPSGQFGAAGRSPRVGEFLLQSIAVAG